MLYYKYANRSNSDYANTGRASLKFRLINQQADFSFALFLGGVSNPKLCGSFKPHSICQSKNGSNEYSIEPGSLNTTDQLIKDLKNYDIVFHIGDMAYADGIPSGRSGTNSWNRLSPLHQLCLTWLQGGECGVVAETMYYVPADNRAKFWYSADYGVFKFCIADTEHDWRAGSEQYKWIEKCPASADRRKQPWLFFAAHRVLGYSSNSWYGQEGSYAERT
ncbi:Metallo-dependent phosphatase-like [Trema orientale]|uniref:Metallo-dependent phosphatase-like n=1 Tax=Trema orientale TaxID=63057 RepID=A0A2P5DFU9_TREOI|nr:Metallo-dependent phosphatase-like [Trema orientale]